MIGETKPWFLRSVAYQIYPRSFYDSNGDGLGDLKGIIKKLDYLANTLGVGAIWLCPFFRSPMADFGYDVSDYETVDPIFGNLDDFKELVKQAHELDIKVITDLVANHTSDEHLWFTESKSSKDNPKRDWYIWRDPGQAGQPPNDWLNVFGGSAWELDTLTNQFYLHSFSAKQPDLNWDNPDVREAIKNVMKFWLKLGVDGFRADAVYWISKDRRFMDDPHNPHFHKNKKSDHARYDTLIHTHSRRGPRLYEYLREMTKVLKDHTGTFMIIEAAVMAAVPGKNQDISEYLNLYKYVDPSFCAPFNFELIHLPWNAKFYKSFIDSFQTKLDPAYLPVYTLGNHDNSRLASRIGEQAARTAAMLLLSLPGLPFIYYGEEIGMRDVPLPNQKQKDPLRFEGLDRDIVRTPMQWSDTKNAGFSTTTPWLPASTKSKEINVENQLADPGSLLNLYRELIKLRGQSDVLKQGSYQAWELGNDEVYGFMRQLENERYAILLNFGSHTEAINLGKNKGTVRLSTYLDKTNLPASGIMNLRPHEAVIISNYNRS